MKSCPCEKELIRYLLQLRRKKLQVHPINFPSPCKLETRQGYGRECGNHRDCQGCALVTKVIAWGGGLGNHRDCQGVRSGNYCKGIPWGGV